MKRILVTAALLCNVSVAVMAGQIPSDGSAAPEPPPPVSAPGDIPSGGFLGDIPSVGLLGQMPSDELAVILSVLGSFV